MRRQPADPLKQPHPQSILSPSSVWLASKDVSASNGASSIIFSSSKAAQMQVR